MVGCTADGLPGGFWASICGSAVASRACTVYPGQPAAGIRLRVLRLFRIFRTLRIIRRFPTLHVMVQAIGGSAGFIVATFTLLAIFAFVFAVISSHFFSGLKHGWCISRENNLNDVASSFLLLFQVTKTLNPKPKP